MDRRASFYLSWYVFSFALILPQISTFPDILFFADEKSLYFLRYNAIIYIWYSVCSEGEKVWNSQKKRNGPSLLLSML